MFCCFWFLTQTHLWTSWKLSFETDGVGTLIVHLLPTLCRFRLVTYLNRLKSLYLESNSLKCSTSIGIVGSACGLWRSSHSFNWAGGTVFQGPATLDVEGNSEAGGGFWLLWDVWVDQVSEASADPPGSPAWTVNKAANSWSSAVSKSKSRRSRKEIRWVVFA